MNSNVTVRRDLSSQISMVEKIMLGQSMVMCGQTRAAVDGKVFA